jgi:hypothetical protein
MSTPEGWQEFSKAGAGSFRFGQRTSLAPALRWINERGALRVRQLPPGPDEIQAVCHFRIGRPYLDLEIEPD